jgi:signal transduction histidine kinase/ActR/RegA family two-component response regulator
VGATYWLLARYSLALPVKSSGISYIWPADGVALASLLLARPRAWPIYLCAIFAGNFLASSKPVELNILYSLFNVCEPLLVATVIGRTLGLRPDLGSLNNAGRFLALTVSCMAVAILITNTIDWLIHRGQFLHTWAIWYVSNTLGMLVVAPLAVCLRSQWQTEWIEATQAQRLEAVVVVVSMGIATFLVFGYWVPPSADLALLPTGLPTVLLFWAALRVGLLGSLIALAILVLQAFRATAAGFGPFANFSGDLNSALVLLQGSLMMITAWVLLSAARTVEWRRAIADNALARRRLEFAIEASGTVAFETHITDSRILWSGDVANVLGIPEHRIASLADWRHHLHPEDRQGVVRAHARLATGRQPFLSIEYRLRLRDGAEVLVTEDAYAVPGPAHASERPRPRMNILGVLHNVTEARRAEDAKRRLEARLAQAQRLEAIGALAGGIAHDFNNILSAILGYAEMLEARTEPGSRARKFVETIAAAGERGRALVAQTLAFSRTPDSDKRAVDLRILMEEVAATISGSLPPGVRLRESIAPGPVVTQGNATHLHQLAMNLCTNAVQAMPDGGELGIVLDVVENGAERTVRGGLLGPGHYVRLAIEDQGAGIDEAALPRIFEPFFSTKALGKGTGLGLSIAHGVAHTHGGAIDVEARSEGGTRFVVYLPASSATVSAAEPAALERAPTGNGETILVIDDEPGLVEMSQDLLAELGYEPVGFTSPTRALAAYDAAPGRFAAVLTDEMMPELTGTQLCARLRQQAGTLPILIATAHGGDGFEARAAQAGATRVLSKPYRKYELATALAAALAQR